MDAETRRQSLAVLGISVLVLVLVNLMARQEFFLGALNLTYRSVCSVMVDAGVAPHILPKGCADAGLSNFAWLAIFPYLFGLLAAAFASAVVSTAHKTENLEARMRLVDLTFQATAFVMVTSTISLMLFYRLPLSVVADETARELLSGFAQGMALFWGIVFTLTLVAIFGPSNLLLNKALADKPEMADNFREKIEKLSTKHQVSKILTMLAPLLVGSSASILEILTKSL